MNIHNLLNLYSLILCIGFRISVKMRSVGKKYNFNCWSN